MEDREGFLWIGTQGGLSRFDGFYFENFSFEENLGSDSVLNLIPDPQSGLWVITTSGVAYWDGQEFQFPAWNRSLSGVSLKSAQFTRDGRLWLASRQGLAFVWNPNGAETITWIESLQGKEISYLKEQANGDIWCGLRFDGLAHYQPQSDRWSYVDPVRLPAPNVNFLAEDEEGTLWVATHQGLSSYDGTNWTPFSANSELPEPIIYELKFINGQMILRDFGGCQRRVGGKWESILPYSPRPVTVTQMMADREGALWLATNLGLWRELGPGQLDHYGIEDGLGSNMVTCLEEDRSGNIWLGTNNGLTRLDKPRLEVLFQEPPRAAIPRRSQIYQIVQDSNGRLWFPNYQGLAVFDGDLRQINADQGLPEGPIHCLAEDRDKKIWVGSPRGCSVLTPEGFRPVDDPLLNNQPIAQILCDPDGSIWFLRGDAQVVQYASNGHFELCELPYNAPIDELRLDPEGLPWLIGNGIFFRRDGEKWESLEHQENGSGPIYDFALSYHGTAWFASDAGLLAQGRNETNLFGPSEGLPGDGVRNLFTGRHQTLWMNVTINRNGSSLPSCIARYDGISFQSYDRKNGLLADEMTGLYEFGDDTTWILHRKGVSLIQGDEIREIGVSQGLAGNGPRKVIGDEKGSFWIATNGGFSKVKGSLVTSYSLRDGLPDGDVMDLFLDDQVLWIRTRGSICRFSENPARPGIKIHKVVSGDRVINPDTQPTFSASENDLTLYFQGITLNRGADQIQFQYKTQKGQKTWFGPIKDNRIALNNLSSGDYNIQVRAFSRDLFESPVPATFQFEIRPPFYMTFWFILTTLLILIGLGYTTYQWRLRLSVARAKAQNELHVAHDLQMSLMPTRQPQLANIEICGFCQPAMEVGGDYYDFFWESEPQLGIAMIDVSGRSMEAAIIAVMTSGLLYGETANVRDPATILQKINRPLHRKSGKKTFVAGLFAALDRDTKRFRWANAGQCAPLLVRGSAVSDLKINRPSLPLGVKPLTEYHAEEVSLQPGDLIFMYTDGLTEATNPENELFGLERLKILLGQLNNDPPSEIIQRVLSGLNHFCREQAPMDDITMVALKIQ